MAGKFFQQLISGGRGLLQEAVESWQNFVKPSQLVRPSYDIPEPEEEPLGIVARNPNILPEFERAGVNIDSLEPTLQAIRKASQETNIPEYLLQDIAFQESRFDPTITNPNSTATGLFQFTQPTWQDMARYYPEVVSTPEDRLDPYISALIAAREIASGRLRRWTASQPVWGEHYSPEELVF